MVDEVFPYHNVWYLAMNSAACQAFASRLRNFTRDVKMNTQGMHCNRSQPCIIDVTFQPTLTIQYQLGVVVGSSFLEHNYTSGDNVLPMMNVLENCKSITLKAYHL